MTAAARHRVGARRCGTGGYTSGGSRGAGKALFIKSCGGCHTLAAAGTAGKIGPNLDDAFAQARDVGMTSATFTPDRRRPDPLSDLEDIDRFSRNARNRHDAARLWRRRGNAFCVDDQDQAASDIAAYVGAVAGTGVTAERPTGGKSIFTSTCGACHTLSDAGTSGMVGPNLDDAKPPKSLVIDRVTNGMGQMPSFKGTLNPAQIQAVADYVSSVAGK